MHVWVLLHVILLYSREEMGTQLSKQVFTMLSGCSKRTHLHTHTHPHTHIKYTRLGLALVSAGFKETTREQSDGAAKVQQNPVQNRNCILLLSVSVCDIYTDVTDRHKRLSVKQKVSVET